MTKKKYSGLKIYIPDTATELEIPLSGSSVHAGFPSMADSSIERTIDLNRELIKNPSSTFFAHVEGDSMQGLGFMDNDLLVVDKSKEIVDKSVAVCCIDGEFVLREIRLYDDHVMLLPANKKFNPIKITTEDTLLIWGRVTSMVRDFTKYPLDHFRITT